MRISKDLLRRVLFVAIATAIYMALVSALAQAAITAPKCIDAGQLAVAHSDTEATWTVYPVQYQTAIYVADGGMTCVFASPVKGEVTIIAATIEEGKVVLSQHVLYNGLPMPTPDPIDPTPTPDPPKPTPPPEPEKTPLELALEKATVYPAKNVQALAATFASVKSGIDRGTVTTVVAARETFRSIWIANAAEVDPQAIKTMGGWIEELSACIDNTSLETIKRDYAVIAEALKANAVARVGADEPTESGKSAEEKSAETPKPTNNCPNGQCPNQPGQVIQRGGFFWR
ncbi:MAG: hypothetical protein IJF84_13325 [Thermoguttaceae bacterium]|nr:hypothetical protein [Thermoguttaceae bacterium]